MASFPCLPQEAAHPTRREEKLARTRDHYVYKSAAENQLAPIPIAKDWSLWGEHLTLSWCARITARWVAATCRREFHLLRFDLQRAVFRFDPLRAYQQLLPRPLPRFAQQSDRDEAFAYWRVAGPNPIGLEQKRSLAALRLRIPLDTQRIETRLRRRLGRPVRLAQEADHGRLFAVDFSLVQSALRPVSERAPLRTRDSRWREKYLPAPIGVFLEAPDPQRGANLLPLAIQIDQLQPARNRERNLVYYPDEEWPWRIAKLYFEVADQSFHLGCSHVHRTHLVMEPFCLATPRQLSSEHPVFVLLHPHTRFTLQANKAAYRYFINRRKTYHEFYSGTLEEMRQIAIQSHLASKAFRDLALERELASRGVQDAPAEYPYRDDARLWLRPIHDFVAAYLGAFYRSDSAVQEDHELQAWAAELMEKGRGAIRGLVPEDQLDTLGKLVDLLSQVIFTAGPGHAAQHFGGNFYHRYAPAFPAAAYAPPPWRGERSHEARFRNTLPPILTASNEVRYSTFTNLQYDRFGHYDRYALGRVEQAREPIARLQAALVQVERTIQDRQAQRMLPYEFLLPSRVPNSINI